MCKIKANRIAMTLCFDNNSNDQQYGNYIEINTAFEKENMV